MTCIWKNNMVGIRTSYKKFMTRHIMKHIIETCLLVYLMRIEKKFLNQWFGIALDKNDIDKRPLTKFCQDVLKQARMEYGRGKKI